MKLTTDTFNSQLSAADAIDRIFPKFGVEAPDVPHYDAEKHMYIVDQHTADSGNRYVTYVAVCRQLVVEVLVGFMHGWTFLDKIRVLVPNREQFEVVSTFEWSETTHYNITILRQKIVGLVSSYAVDNIGLAGVEASEDLMEQARALATKLLDQDVNDHANDNDFLVLRAYCRQMNLCKDFVTNQYA